ncbi:hypothetical protein CORC01_11197 [Colletotrichum orchidophilum]|uniref:Uncharacterized protein n=1 Tax=Colletotrichum orchidophilum TaxID=1209926 RepID=A0A1G4AWK5_9PEZI|nr:uncharacterized protein CORC01_11197 [Colletotrichum orchidophilum]OHE93511.1 hypothetical protein CORC01_11197 [Colletotrichum orchidophilum]
MFTTNKRPGLHHQQQMTSRVYTPPRNCLSSHAFFHTTCVLLQKRAPTLLLLAAAFFDPIVPDAGTVPGHDASLMSQVKLKLYVLLRGEEETEAVPPSRAASLCPSSQHLVAMKSPTQCAQVAYFVAPIGHHRLITPLVASVTVPDAVVSVQIHELGPIQANTASTSPGILVCVALRILMHFERFHSLGSRRQLISGNSPTGHARSQVSTAKHRLRLLGVGIANHPRPFPSKSTRSGGNPASNQPNIIHVRKVGWDVDMSGSDVLHYHAKACHEIENQGQRYPSEAPKHAQTGSDLAARHVRFPSETSSGQWFDDACHRCCTVQP